MGKPVVIAFNKIDLLSKIQKEEIYETKGLSQILLLIS